MLITSIQHSGVSCTRNEEELYGAVTIKHRKGQPFNFAKLEEKPLVEHPLPSPLAPGLRPFQEPPPSPGGPPGQNP